MRSRTIWLLLAIAGLVVAGVAFAGCMTTEEVEDTGSVTATPQSAAAAASATDPLVSPSVAPPVVSPTPPPPTPDPTLTPVLASPTIPGPTPPPTTTATPAPTATPEPTSAPCPVPMRKGPEELGPPIPESQLGWPRVEGTANVGAVTLHLPAGRQFLVSPYVMQPDGPNAQPFVLIYDVQSGSVLHVRPDGCELERFVRDPAVDPVFDEIVGADRVSVVRR